MDNKSPEIPAVSIFHRMNCLPSRLWPYNINVRDSKFGLMSQIKLGIGHSQCEGTSLDVRGVLLHA